MKPPRCPGRRKNPCSGLYKEDKSTKLSLSLLIVHCRPLYTVTSLYLETGEEERVGRLGWGGWEGQAGGGGGAGWGGGFCPH